MYRSREVIGASDRLPDVPLSGTFAVVLTVEVAPEMLRVAEAGARAILPLASTAEVNPVSVSAPEDGRTVSLRLGCALVSDSAVVAGFSPLATMLVAGVRVRLPAEG